MDEDWRNTFGILMHSEICSGAGVGICDSVPLTCSSFICFYFDDSLMSLDNPVY